MQITYTLDQIDEVAAQLLTFCTHRTILFEGDMGAGKTTLIKAIIKNLGSNDTISSPTFSLVNEYATNEGIPIYHFDFYRIKDQNEAEQLGLEEYFDEKSWIFIEWPQNINIKLPYQAHTAKIKSLNNEERTLKVC